MEIGRLIVLFYIYFERITCLDGGGINRCNLKLKNFAMEIKLGYYNFWSQLEFPHLQNISVRTELSSLGGK
jgi:hypothetical protein